LSNTPSKRGPDLLACSLPGTALHRLTALLAPAPRDNQRQPAGSAEYLHVRDPLLVAEELRRRALSQRGAGRRRLAAAVCPGLALPRRLPLGVVALVAGVVLVALQRYWAGALVAYGLVALIHGSLARRRFNRRLLAGIDEAIKPDLQAVRSDRTKAEAIRERFGHTGDLGFLEGATPPEGLALAQGERVLLSVERTVSAKRNKAGLLRLAEGTLLVTTARLLFLGPPHSSELELGRIVRADVRDDLRLTVTPSKREAPGIYFNLGHAHELAEVIRLAHESL
jgi:hypothetical protein